MAYIVIEGVIGVGKTTLTHLLGDYLTSPTIFEAFEENPFLSDFYHDKSRYAFQTELFFLLTRYRQQKSLIKDASSPHHLISDYLFAKSKIFASLNLINDEWDLFCHIYDELLERVVQPDLVVYLQASVETLMTRIFSRDRQYERNMDIKYIDSLVRAYEMFFRNSNYPQLIKIETDSLDLVRDLSARQKVFDLIKAKLSNETFGTGSSKEKSTHLKSRST